MAQYPYQFMRVEDFFGSLQGWESLSTATAHTYDPATHTVVLRFTSAVNTPLVALLTVVERDTLRVRFNPSAAAATDYSPANSRSIVMDKLDDLAASLRATDPFRVDASDGAGSITLVTSGPDGAPFMRVAVTHEPFAITVYGYSPAGDYKIWQTAAPAIQFTPNGATDFAIVQCVQRPVTGAYVGFGEHGGKSLLKANERLTYFNFDNYEYREVYGIGPLDQREPLYHSDPFFMEFNGVPDRDSVYGVYLDNPGQAFVDIGQSDSSRYMLGTRFGDLDYYVFVGHTAADVVSRFTSLVGRSRLKPRYSLGYHQGCYGYEDRKALEWAVDRYRANAIPLDGLHIDVDVQHNYETFTVNEERFPNPADMFARLRAQGVKCATNITPIISDVDPTYATHQQGTEKGFFVLDTREDAADPAANVYEVYEGGDLKRISDSSAQPRSSYNSGGPYVGEVNYGGTLGTTGNYPNLAVRKVRDWWGKMSYPGRDPGGHVRPGGEGGRAFVSKQYR